ncbi:MAG: PAS domain S-box protein [Jaaginema sp. PMC 1080.18]|nr:PAS domain S-box protein [Jaaginema sp. PMC 1080.18]MEC4865026.1 PAS domain S-box protein [Jaaginema sp. PMC 1078.18]
MTDSWQFSASILTQLPVAIAVFDTQGTWLTASQAWLDDWQLTSESLQNQHFNQIFAAIPPSFDQAFQDALKGIQTPPQTQQWRNPEGSPFWVQYEMRPWYHENSVQGVILQINHSSSRQQHLSAWDNVFELSPDMMCIVGFDGYFHLLNPTWENVLGYSNDELQAQPFLELIHPDDRQSTLDAAQRLTEGQSCIDFENRYRCKDGSYRWLQWTATPILNGSKIYATVRDITASKEAELEVQKLMALITYSSDFIGVASLEGNPIFLNPAGLQMMGFPSLEVAKNHHIKDFIYPEDLPFVEQVIFPTVLKQGRWQGEIRFRRFDNQEAIAVDYNIFIIKHPETQAPLAFATVTRDLRDRKAAEKEQNRLLAIIEATTDCITTANAQGQITYINKAGRDMLGFGLKEDVTSLIIPDLLGESSRQTEINNQMPILLEKGIITGETTFQHQEGYEIPVSQVAIAHKSETGEVEFFSNVARDISDRKRSEAALRESQMRFQAILDNAPAAIFIKSIAGQYLVMNRHAEALLNLEPNHCLGKTDYDIFPSEMARNIRQAENQIIEKRQAAQLEEEIVTPDGIRTYFSIKFPLFDADGQVYAICGIANDITDRKLAEIALQQQTQELENTLRELRRTQSQLIQNEKLSSLGHLVAGVAHEINNPVNFIYGNLTHAREYIKDLLELVSLYQKSTANSNPEIQEVSEEIDLEFLLEDLPKLLDSMKIGADRIKQIVASLRNFSRTDETDIKKVDIHEGIESTLMILRNRLKAKSDYPEIQVIRNYSSIPPIECYPGPLNQVFMNILVNAIDAIEEHQQGKTYAEIKTQSGTIAIETQLESNDNIKIIIADNAGGIPETIISCLFDPFFTTKAVGKGTGLGLSISYQIITEKHKGTLECFSEIGKGTKFVIAIPVRQTIRV